MMKEILWDPTETVATRPLAIQKDGTWFTFGWDITKNIWELFGPAGYIRTTYSYEPFGNVSMNASGVVQPFRFSSEFYDEELDLVYYNYRHYSPSLGRFLSRDPIEEQGGLNLYAFVENNSIIRVDVRGEGYWSCLKDCFFDNDPTGLIIDKVLVYLSGAAIPKSVVAMLYDALGYHSQAAKLRGTLRAGASPYTTLPSMLSAALRMGGRSALRIYGRFFAPIAAVQTAVDASVLTYCSTHCLGKDGYCRGTGNLYMRISTMIEKILDE